ncbi:hypothetical protein [Pseudomonas maumuensis]|uniref:Uncharacterized protein n=1 Tax=Pseudomonas maumuensis TaxID=2842354 RepID=A0ABX8NL56_9PSED|nr:hypothetical protein [Pseudomonas maumuensis]QXH56709.1 hypothetical protein KSS90_00410 [Pseudomonas maumuensis]
MNVTRWLMLAVLGLVFQSSAMAKDMLLTAHVGADGKVLRQWPEWISQVERQAQANYFTQYTLKLNPRIVHQDPGFCSVSPIDASSYDRQMHGQAKVIGKPLAEHLSVMTQLVDMKGASGDNSLEFLLLCVR